MKRVLTSILALLLAAPAALGQVRSIKEIKAPPLRNFSIPQPKRIQLPNGMVIFLQEDRELPLIAGTALIRGGSRDVPADKTGMLGIYTQAWRTGGTASQTGDQLDELLEARAARVETSGGTDSTSVSMDILKGDLDAVYPIWVEILRNPAFRQDKIDLAKTQINTSISRRNDEPGGILGREAQKLGYGADSPYARVAEYATVASVTRDDLIAFHRRTVHPNNIIVSFIGDFDAAAMEKRLRDTFGGWARGPQMAKPATPMNPAKPGIYFVNKEDVTQANIAMVHPGTTRDNPDYYALVVMNEIFGGGFSGRLMQTLRSQRGLTYGVGGGVGANWDYPGLFRVQMATKSETTLESIAALRDEVNKLTNSPVTEAEMSLAKESILNAYVFTMDTRAKALNQQVLLEFYGFPADYYVKYPSQIEKVTAADVQRVAKKYVNPNQLAVLVVGNAKNFEKPLSTLGQVQTIDITIPEPGAKPGAGGSADAARAGTNAEGKALLAKVTNFVGGKAALDAVKVVRVSGNRTMVTPQGEMQMEIDGFVQYPDRARMEMKLPMGTMTMVITPETAFAVGPMGTQDLPSSQREASVEDMKTDLINILKSQANPGYTFTATGTEKIGDINAAILEISPAGGTVKWFVDPATGRILRSVRTTRGPMGGTIVTDYTNWQKHGGINMATATTVTRDGQPFGSMTVTNVEINPQVPADTFVKK